MSITTVRPTSTDQTFGTVTVVGSGGANGVTDDAPADDATYITSSQWGAGVSLGLADVTLAANRRIKQVRGHIRCFHNSADIGHTDEIDWRFRDGTFANTSKATTLGTSNNSAQDKYTGWYTTYPGKTAFSWTNARFNRVQANIAWRARDTTQNGNPQITQLRISEVYVDLDIHDQLSVTAVNVTGNTSTSKPTFSWTLAVDPDGDLQTRWDLAIFTSAQVATSGFNPDTSPAVYRKGATGGSLTNFQIPVNLTDGFTYQAFVRVAKDWPGPDGPLWWSNWTSSGNFTVTLTAPPAPTLAITQELTLPGYRNRIVATVVGINDLDAATASFELNTIGNWVAGTNANTPTVSGTNPKSGSFAGSVTSVAAGNVEILSGTFATSKRVRPGDVRSATVSTRAVTAARTVQVGIRWFDSTGATISTPMSAGNANVTTGYTTHTLANQTAPANAYSYVERVLILSTAAAGEQTRFDEAGLMRGASATWGQGGYADSGTITFFRLLRVDPRLGQGPAINWTHEQIRSAGGLLDTTEGFYARASADEIFQRPLDRAFPGNPDTANDSMIEVFVHAGATSFLDIGAVNGLVTDLSWPYLSPAVPTMSFTFQAWVWVDSGSKACKYGITWVDESNNLVNSTFSANVTVTTTPQLITFTATAPAGTVYARPTVDLSPSGTVTWRHRITGISFGPTTPNAPACETLVPWDGQLAGAVNEVEIEILRNGEDVPLAIDGDDDLVIYDHEAPPDRPVIYAARFSALNISGDPVASPPSDGTSVYMTVPARTLLKDPFNPARAAIVNVTSPSSQGRNVTADDTELHGLDRDDDPVFIRSWMGHERTLEITTDSYLESARMAKLLESARSLLVQWADGGQTYLRVKSAADVRFTRGKDRAAVTASETRKPPV